MNASPYRRFSSLSPAMQMLIIQLIQEEFTSLLALPAETMEADWVRAVKLVDPTLLYCTAHEPAIKICPDSYQQLLALLQLELASAK